ncbi:MAG: methyltransferase domain-containing protein [Chloroflexi bacterium]|nr:methyltransferase domain-containing protein [Chloroflexota bacterium]
MNTMTNQPLSERLDFLREAAATSAAIDVAESLGVFARLDQGPADALSLARDCAIGERGAGVLLSALASLGLVEADAERVYHATTPDLVGLAALRTRWNGLAEVLRTDQPVIAGDSRAVRLRRIYPSVVPHLAMFFAAAAARAADHLSVAGLRVLDVGAGAAPWSIALAARDPECHVTAVDLPAVAAVTRQAVARAGLETQFAYVGGDIFAVDWGTAAYDLAIAGNLCHLFDESTNRRLLGHLLLALRPGGRLAILDAIVNERSDGPRAVVLYALGLLMRTSQGRVYPFSTYAGWLRDAGYEGVELHELSSSRAISLITARRP